MKHITLTYKTLFVAFVTLFAFSCKKPGVEPLGDAGQTIVKISSEDGFRLAALDLVSTPQNVNIIEILRDVHNEASLNSTMKVIIQEDQSLVTAYNAAHNTSYIALPANSFTVDASNPRVNGQYTVTFNPGEFYKTIKVTFPDATVLSPSSKYAVGFRILSVDGNGKPSAELKNVVVEVGVKNRWDGVYKVTGTMVDLTNNTLVGFYPLTWELRTTGANTVTVYDKDYTGTPTHIISTGTGLSQYGSFGLNLTFDPVTNKITSVTNFYGQPASNGRSAALDPTGVNAYDPVTKTIRIKYFLLQPGTTVRTTFDETWVYTGPR